MVERKMRYGKDKKWFRRRGRRGIENDEEKKCKKLGNGK